MYSKRRHTVWTLNVDSVSLFACNLSAGDRPSSCCCFSLSCAFSLYLFSFACSLFTCVCVYVYMYLVLLTFRNFWTMARIWFRCFGLRVSWSFVLGAVRVFVFILYARLLFSFRTAPNTHTHNNRHTHTHIEINTHAMFLTAQECFSNRGGVGRSFLGGLTACSVDSWITSNSWGAWGMLLVPLYHACMLNNKFSYWV